MKKFILFGMIITALLGLSACGKLDVIGEQSEKSFEAVLNALPDRVSEDTEFGGWSIEVPDQEAKFYWSENFSKTSPYDVKLVINAQPFLDAGLDPEKLPEGMLVDDKIIVGMELGQEKLTYTGEATPLDSYKKLLQFYRTNITYHAALDHYGVDLSNGNVFEWAKDMKANDKDIVLALNPQPFLDAGVNPDQVEGWIFAKVETMDEKGKKIQVDKFLKPFDVVS